MQEFKLYMKKMVARERAAAAGRSEPESNNLLSALVRAYEAAPEGYNKSASAGNVSLVDDELYGNLFIYNLAGHESTANTLAAAIAYLAVQPRWQD